MPGTKKLLCSDQSVSPSADLRGERSGLTTAQYITNLLTEYYEMKKNGGHTTMANSNGRTMAFQISEELFRPTWNGKSSATGRKITQREFFLTLIEEALNEAERQALSSAVV